MGLMIFDVEACLVVFIVVSTHVDDRTFQDILWSVCVNGREGGRGHTGRLTMYRRRVAPHCRMRELPDYLKAPDPISCSGFLFRIRTRCESTNT